MRRLAILTLLGAALAMTGCVAIHPSGTCGPSCDDIDDATKIALSSQRLAVLNNIAARKFLSQHEQFYLVEATIRGGIGGEQAEPLVTLICNPVCTPETRKYISDNLRFMMYSRERRRVAEVLTTTDPANPKPPGQ